jgi:hypothetical protein
MHRLNGTVPRAGPAARLRAAGPDSMGRALLAGAVYVAIVFAAGFALGVVRSLMLEPAVGPLAAVALELPVMLAVAWFTCGRLLHRWPLSGAGAIVMGAVAFAALMALELGVSLGLAGRSLAGHWALYRQTAHQLGLAGQIAFALFPLVQARRRSPPGRG